MINALLLGALLLGQSSTAEIKSARALAKSANSWTGSHAKARKMFMSMEEGKSWVPMKTEDDHLDKEGMWNNEVGSVAYAWIRDGRTLQVTVTQASSSGDWIQISDSVYRKDGSLARVFSTYSAFSPEEGLFEREMIFSPGGKMLLDKAAGYDLQRKKKLSSTKAQSLKSNAPSLGVWMKVKDLPFVALLNK